MPRSNRPRRRGPADDDDEAALDLSRILTGGRRTEHRRSGTWNVQSVSGSQAGKEYVCPGCSLTVTAGTPHIVAWRADGLMGEASDLAARRHWHSHCWKIGR
ncbi:hypothetical protein [Agreia sp. COWG]|uniref:hypothetical protein n=1 Tax=Agreia sp. COWG TaxID=2773266 RepID=UPI0019254BC7|nr:hypothetical protein [Agreia sp. COWG]CAD5995688.1 ATP/GTP-binding protein [Agreia sp. COWG]